MKIKAAIITSLRRREKIYTTSSILKSPLHIIKLLIATLSVIVVYRSLIPGSYSADTRGLRLSSKTTRVEVSKEEENLVLNPNFEGGSTSSWKAFGKSTLDLKRRSSAEHGSNVASTTDSKDWHGITQKIGSRLTEGVRYQVSAFVQLDTADKDVLIGFSDGDNDEDQTVLSPRQQNGLVVSETIDVKNEWVLLQGTYTASSDKDITLYIKAPKGVKLMVDFVEVVEADCDFNHFVRDFNPDELEINCSNWDKLKMGEVLGHGRSRQVVEATWKGNKVAVKQPLHNDRQKSRPGEVLRVAALNNQLAQSENIVKIIGMCDSSLVFEYAPTLLKSVVFDEEKLSVERSLRLGLDIVKGLAQLHSIGPVVHGDLRISQYLVNPEGRVLLGDLESSRYVGLDRNGKKCTFWKKAGGKGTFNSPERLSESAELDEKTDIYRNALTLWTVFTREFPFQGEEDVKDLVLGGERPSLDALEGYPQEVKDMLVEAWDADPTKRPSAEDMVKTMTAVVNNYKPEDDSDEEEYGEENEDDDDDMAPYDAAYNHYYAAEKKSVQEDIESADDNEYGEEKDSGDGVTPMKATTPTSGNQDGCLDAHGPQPYILLTRGRSGTGSGSTWQIIGNLTGYETPNDRPTGGMAVQSKKFFDGKDTDNWLHEIFCTRQEAYPKAGIVGFKWKMEAIR